MTARRLAPRSSVSPLAAAVALVAAAGCATVRAAREAQDPASAVPGERTPTAAELGLATAGPAVLDDLVRAAVRVHPSVVRARRAAEAAATRVGVAEATRRPRAEADAAVSVRDGSPSTGAPGEHRFRSLGFEVTWLVFDFGGADAGTRAAGELWLAAQSDLRTAEIDAAFAVRVAYHELARRVELAAVARETVVQSESHLDEAREFVRVGTRIPYDVTRAEVEVGNARLADVAARDAVLAAQAALAGAVGLAEVVDWTPVPVPLPAAEEGFDAVWDRARRGQPALAAAAAREAAASAIVDARIAALYPAFDLSFGWAAGGPSFPLPWNWEAGPVARWVPFDGFENLSTIDEAVAVLRGARAARAKAEQRAWLEVREAWLAMAAAGRRLEVAALVVRSAAENLDLAQGLFGAGKATSVDVVDARRALTQARADEVASRSDRAAASARLARAAGE